MGATYCRESEIAIEKTKQRSASANGAKPETLKTFMATFGHVQRGRNKDVGHGSSGNKTITHNTNAWHARSDERA